MNEMPELQDAHLSVEDRVATLILDRDDVRNELTGTGLTQDIIAVTEWIRSTQAVSVLVITGAGSAFSAGGNVKHMRDRTGAFGGDVYEVHNKYRLGLHMSAKALHDLEVPSIAAINGPAIGAGFDLATMCDIRLAADTATLGSTFLNLGIVPGDGGTWFLQRLVGSARAAELIFTGRVMRAPEAKELGLLLDVVPADRLMPATNELARRIAAKPPQALRLAKRLLKSAPRMELPDFLELCAVYQGMCHNTADHQEAVAAFLEKRPATFRGV